MQEIKSKAWDHALGKVCRERVHLAETGVPESEELRSADWLAILREGFEGWKDYGREGTPPFFKREDGTVVRGGGGLGIVWNPGWEDSEDIIQNFTIDLDALPPSPINIFPGTFVRQGP